MYSFFKKKFIIPVVASAFLFIGTSFKDDFFEIAYKYIRNVQLLDVSALQHHNNFTKADNLKHFILFQS